MSSFQWASALASMSRMRSNSPRTMKDPTVMRIPKASAFGVKCLLSGFKYSDYL